MDAFLKTDEKLWHGDERLVSLVFKKEFWSELVDALPGVFKKEGSESIWELPLDAIT